jgi:acyl-CoA synthetase (AMP-forming)/AMP-acid ligase II
MHKASRWLNPRYVRLSGEVADQPILDGLRAAFPNAHIAHAFASTEAGVAFTVEDGRAGFPASWVHGDAGDPERSVDLKVADGTLHIRSRRTAACYLGQELPRVAAAEGFVDTGDLVELVGDRYYFRGRRGGIINVGGLKVFPEEVEAVLNADPRVRMALVHPRPNPITGAIVVADVVLVNPGDPPDDPGRAERIKSDLLQACRQRLARHKVPASLRLVEALPLTPGGKLMRSNA